MTQIVLAMRRRFDIVPREIHTAAAALLSNRLEEVHARLIFNCKSGRVPLNAQPQVL